MSAVRSLWEGAETAATLALGITSLRHRSALRSLGDITNCGTVRAVYAALAENYCRSGASTRKDRSTENWRWCLQPQISSKNLSPEVCLERAIATACCEAGRRDWANQIPVASGLIPGADRRRAIDLACKRDSAHFEFIELKIASDNPLSAAIQIIGYACLWLIARNDPPTRWCELLKARRIDLRVLAPAKYYASFDLQPLEWQLNQEVQLALAATGVSFSFAYDVLPDELITSERLPHEASLELLSLRQPLRS